MANPRQKSRSDVQQQAEEWAIGKFGEILGRKLTPKQFKIDGCSVQVDGWAESPDTVILVECWTHIGTAKPAQRDKVISDILKLLLVREWLGELNSRAKVECYFLFVDGAAMRILTGNSWASKAATRFHVIPKIVRLLPSKKKEILAAQNAQNLMMDK